MKILVCDDQPEAAEKFAAWWKSWRLRSSKHRAKKPPQVHEQHLRRLLFMLAELSCGLKNALSRRFLRTAVRRLVQVHGPRRQKKRSRRDTA